MMGKFFLTLSLCFLTLSAVAAEGVQESVYGRVMQSGKLRCGYVIYPPYFDRDLNTGEFSGVYQDLMMKLGKELSLDIEWTEETGLADAFTALNAGRFDAVCAGFWAVPGRARAVNFTTPFYYDALYVVARADDDRFDNNWDRINKPDVKVFVLEGETSQFVAQDYFPGATHVTQPNLSDPASRMLDIVTGKGDVTVTSRANFRQFEKNNPGKLKIIAGGPVWTGRAGIVVPKGEFDLWLMLGTAIDHLNNTGYTQRVLKKYPGLFLPVAKPYEDSQQ